MSMKKQEKLSVKRLLRGRKSLFCFSSIIVVWICNVCTLTSLQGQEPTWIINSDGMVNVDSLYSGTGPVEVTLDGASTTYPNELTGFILSDSSLGGPTLTLQGVWGNDKKPDSSIFDVKIQMDNSSNEADSKVILVTPAGPGKPESIFDQIYLSVFQSEKEISGYGTIEKLGTGTWLTSAKSENFHGNTIVKEGVFSVGVSGIYGSADRTGNFTVQDGAILAICGGIVTEAPVLNANTLQFNANEGSGGSGIIFNVAGPNQRLANINVNSLAIGSGTELWFDGIGVTAPGSKISVAITALTDGITQVDATGSVVNTLSGNDLAAMFSRPLVSFANTSTIDGERTEHILTGTVRSVRSYAKTQNLSDNQLSAAAALDKYSQTIRSTTNYKDIYPAYQMLDVFYNKSDTAYLNRTLANMSQTYGIENFYAMISHFGTAGSVFFNGGDEAGTSFPACPRFKTSQSVTASSVLRGKEPDASNGSSMLSKGLWAAPFYSTMEVDGNGNIDGFEVHRIGVMGGFRGFFDEKTKGGIFFAWSSPELTQSGSLLGYSDHYRSKITMSDFQFAAHLERKLWACFELSMFLGGGRQTTDWTRSINGNIGFDREYSGETTGSTLTATVYLSRPTQITERLRLTPMIGFDSEHAWLGNFDEEESIGPKTYPGSFSQAVLYSAHQYYDLEYHRNMLRAGLIADYFGERSGLSAKVFYGGRLGGDERTSVNTVSYNRLFNMELQGLEYDDYLLNLGLGGWWRIGQQDNKILSGNYNCNMGNHSTAHNFNLVYNWLF